MAWTGACIALDRAPDPVILDLALSSRHSVPEVASSLGGVRGTADDVPTFLLVLRHALDALEAGTQRADDLARYLYRVASEAGLPLEPFGPEPYYLEDYLELAGNGGETYEE